MKKTTRHGAAALSMILASLFSPLAAAPGIPAFLKPSFSLGTSAGFFHGAAREYVYENDEILSELVWPIETMPTAGLDLSLLWGKKLDLSGSVDIGLSGDAGTMTDSDFLNLPGSAARTHYSAHDAHLAYSLDMSATLGWKQDLPLTGPFSKDHIQVFGGIGLRGIMIKWTGSDGYYQYADNPGSPSIDSDGDGKGDTYAEWDESVERVPMAGPVISYEQDYFIPKASLALEVPVASRLRARLGVEGSPFVQCYGIDNHIKRSTFFYDILDGGWLLGTEASLTFRASEGVSLFAEGEWTSIAGLRGDTYEKKDGSDVYGRYPAETGSGGGAAYEAGAVRVGLMFTAE